MDLYGLMDPQELVQFDHCSFLINLINSFDFYFILSKFLVHSLPFSSFIFILQGESTKMSASNPNSAIYVTDSSKQIKGKVCPSYVLIWNHIYQTITFYLSQLNFLLKCYWIQHLFTREIIFIHLVFIFLIGL